MDGVLSAELDNLVRLRNLCLLVGGVLIYWVLGYLASRAFPRYSAKAMFILIGYLSQLVPWMFIGRITFAYHYFPSILFLVLALAYVFNDLVGRRAPGWRAAVYGTTGGVAEAVVRHCMPDKSRNTLRALEYSPLRGNESIREATIPVGDREIKLAVVHGLINAQKLLKEIDEGTAYYDLIEVMTCPNGCVGGAGQPYGLKAKKQARSAGLYATDRSAPFKRAEYNPGVTSILQKLTDRKSVV